MQTLRTVLQESDLMTEQDVKDLVQAVTVLPAATTANVGKRYLLTAMYRTANKVYLSGRTYECKLGGSGLDWVVCDYHETGVLGSFKNVWSSSMLNDEGTSATIFLHWQEPDDLQDITDSSKNAIWDHTVIMKKRGSYPTDITDGELVGYSSVRDQYNEGSGFADRIDPDAILDDTPTSAKYFYSLFWVTKGCLYGTDADSRSGSVLDWDELHRLIQNGSGPSILPVGSILKLPKHQDFGVIEMVVAAHDNAKLVNTENKHSITLIAKDILLRAIFDYKEEYPLGPTEDTVWNSNKVYYAANKTIVSVPVANPKEANLYEANPATNGYSSGQGRLPSERGCNSWSKSNIRQWLNSMNGPLNASAGTATWFASKQSTWDKVYSLDDSAAAYKATDGSHATGFLGGFVGSNDDERTSFLNLVAEVINTTGLSKYDPDFATRKSETTVDRVFLPSHTEVFSTTPKYGLGLQTKATALSLMDLTAVDEGTPFPLYTGSFVTNRQKYYNHQLCSWYLRTADISTPSYVTAVSCINIDPVYIDEYSLALDQDYMFPACYSTSELSNRIGNYPANSDGTRGNWEMPGIVPCIVLA